MKHLTSPGPKTEKYTPEFLQSHYVLAFNPDQEDTSPRVVGQLSQNPGKKTNRALQFQE